MGTLFEQRPRDYKRVGIRNVDASIRYIKDMAEEHNITYEQVLETFKYLEYQRRTDFLVDNGDILDEQLSDFGDVFIRFCEAIESAFSSDDSEFSRHNDILSEISERIDNIDSRLIDISIDNQ